MPPNINNPDFDEPREQGVEQRPAAAEQEEIEQRHGAGRIIRRRVEPARDQRVPGLPLGGPGRDLHRREARRQRRVVAHLPHARHDQARAKVGGRLAQPRERLRGRRAGPGEEGDHGALILSRALPALVFRPA